MKTITLTEFQIDNLIVDELQNDLMMQFNLNTSESGEYLEPDYELIKALKTTLRYYASATYLYEFFEEISMREAGVQAQLDKQNGIRQNANR